MPKGTCTADDCREPRYCRDLCIKHYGRLRKTGSLELAPRKTLEQRFWEKVDKNGPIPTERPDLGNCWDWTRALNEDGYGSIGTGGRNSTAGAHRVGYELMVGPIPPGLVIDHLCCRPRCIRYSHLQPVPQSVNIARGKAPAALQEFASSLRAKTHCKHGHEFTPENTRIKPNGNRICKACARNRAAEIRARPGHSEKMAAWLREYRKRQKAERLARAG